MTTYTRPVTGGTPTTGQVVKAVHVNEPIDQIYDTILAGGITSDQIAVGAVDTSELATEAVTAAKMDGTLPDDSEMATSAAPTTDKQLANKKYVDDNTTMVPAVTGAGTGYAGEESITFANGAIMKTGSITSASASGTVTFGTAFPTAQLTLQLTIFDNAATTNNLVFITFTTTNFTWSKSTAINGFHWTAIGY